MIKLNIYMKEFCKRIRVRWYFNFVLFTSPKYIVKV